MPTSSRPAVQLGRLSLLGDPLLPTLRTDPLPPPPPSDVCTGRAPTTYVTTTAAASYVYNTYSVSFPYILPVGVAASTALADVNACDAALQQCSQAYLQCTAVLEGSGSGGGTTSAKTTTSTTTSTTTASAANDAGGGGGAAVTIVIAGSTTFTKGGGATTAAAAAAAAAQAAEADSAAIVVGAAATTLAAADAASVCSSLRSQACGGLPTNTAACSALFASVAATQTAGSGTDSSSATRQMEHPLGQALAVAAAAIAYLAVAGRWH